jgi:glycosyl transferase family 1
MEIGIFSPAHDLYRSQQRGGVVAVVRRHLARMLTYVPVVRESSSRLHLFRRAVRRAEVSTAVVSVKLRPSTRPAVFGLAICIDKAKWLLDHPQERRVIAQAGQRRTLAEHTYDQRARELDALIREALGGAGPVRQPG